MNMAELPHPWGAYASYQDKLSKTSSVDDYAWGLESGLDSILACPSPAEAPGDEVIARTVASGARRSRYCKALIAKFAEAVMAPSPSDQGRIEARSDIQQLQRVLSIADFRMLVSVGQGVEQKLIAESEGVSAPALRTRIARARTFAITKLAA
jgi:hypothetical protein